MKRLTPYLYVLIATACWGLWGGVIKLTGVSPIFAPFFAAAVSSAILGIAIVVRRERVSITRTDVKYFILLGLAGAATSATLFPAFKLLPVSEAIFIHYLAPVVIVIFDRFFLGVRITARSLVSLVTAFTGMLVILGGGSGFRNLAINAGVLFAFASAVFYASSVLISKFLAPRYDTVLFIFVMNGLAALFLSPVLFGARPHLSLFSFAILTATSILTSLVAAGSYLAGLRRLSAHVVGLISYGEILFAGLWAFILVGERPTEATLAGGLFILLSGAILFGGRVNETQQ